MDIVTRIFLLFTVCLFVGVTSANAAMPCCMTVGKAMSAAMPGCHNASKAGDAQPVKHHGGDCQKCQCMHGMSVSALVSPAYAGREFALASAAFFPAGALLAAFAPSAADNPPKSFS
jgi:hypothetical protein